MPTLNWIGKEAVVEHHRHVPTRLLECDAKLSAGDPDAENLLVEGDNLEALKALLPRYRGQVKCIYIDPPYNTCPYPHLRCQIGVSSGAAKKTS